MKAPRGQGSKGGLKLKFMFLQTVQGSGFRAHYGGCFGFASGYPEVRWACNPTFAPIHTPNISAAQFSPSMGLVPPSSLKLFLLEARIQAKIYHAKTCFLNANPKTLKPPNSTPSPTLNPTPPQNNLEAQRDSLPTLLSILEPTLWFFRV